MASLRLTMRTLPVLLLVLYGILLPLLLLETVTAHKRVVGGVFRHSVHGRRLDYIDSQNTDYRHWVNIARDEWKAASKIGIKEVDKKKDAEIRIVDANSCSVRWIGEYDYAKDSIRFNKCAMNWDGGVYPGTGENLGSTPASRKARTAVHEFGHALGLDHNSLGDCNSILHDDVRYDEVTCYIPTSHDRNDMADYWP